MEIIPFKTEHIDKMKESNIPSYMKYLDPKMLEGLLSFTAMENDKVLMCAGAIEIWAGRYLAWAKVSPDAKPHLKQLHRAIKKFYKTLNAPRVEADIDSDFPEAKKWAEVLGFTCEKERRVNFFPDGKSADLYVMIGK